MPATGYAKSGSAVLANGTATVADAKITGSARVLLSIMIPGGTVGIPQITARAAGTGFTITSASATDTSTIAYNVLTY